MSSEIKAQKNEHINSRIGHKDTEPIVIYIAVKSKMYHFMIKLFKCGENKSPIHRKNIYYSADGA